MQCFVYRVREEPVLFYFLRQRIIQEEIRMNEHRKTCMIIVVVSGSGNLIRSFEEHAAFFKIIITLSVFYFSTEV